MVQTKKQTKTPPTMNKWMRTGDKVVVIAGNEKGKTGKVLSRTEKRVLIEGINVRKKHVKPTQDNPKGSIAEIELSMNISNVAACDESGKPVRLKVRTSDKGAKELVYNEGTKQVVYRTVRGK